MQESVYLNFFIRLFMIKCFACYIRTGIHCSDHIITRVLTVGPTRLIYKSSIESIDFDDIVSGQITANVPSVGLLLNRVDGSIFYLLTNLRFIAFESSVLRKR